MLNITVIFDGGDPRRLPLDRLVSRETGCQCINGHIGVRTKKQFRRVMHGTNWRRLSRRLTGIGAGKITARPACMVFTGLSVDGTGESHWAGIFKSPF